MMRFVIVSMALWFGAAPARADKADAKPNLASLGAGAIVVKQPAAYSESWTGFWLIDEAPSPGYAPPEDDIGPKEIVIELADKDEISEVAFDIAQAESEERAAKTIKVEISDKPDTGFSELLTAPLARAKDTQHFTAKAPKPGRYLKVTTLANFGSKEYVELMGFAAYGKVVAKMPGPDFSGSYTTSYGTFRVKQTGAAATGCYEFNNGLIVNGGFDGRVMRFTWKEVDRGGPAVLVLPSDGKGFFGLWWETNGEHPSGRWEGTFASKTIGVCPHYKFDTKASTGGDVAAALRSEGRVRLYGITFATDSDHIKDESKGTLDQIVATAKAEPTWKLAIEGHTDGVGAADHNRQLSEKRAAAVKAYLVKAGVAAHRLTTHGFGATKPLATHDTSLGRSQNRRVEISK